jgi:HlyD family secretion protein
MARKPKIRWGRVAVPAIALPLLLLGQVSLSMAQNADLASKPLSVRGYTDAPDGTAIVAIDQTTGGSVAELRVKEGQKISRGDIVAVLSTFQAAEISMRSAAAELEKGKQQRDAMKSGYRVTEIAMQEVAVSQSEKESRVKVLEMHRSSKPDDQKQLEITISRQALEKDRAKLKMVRETLTSDLAQAEADVAIKQAKLDNAVVARERALVRSPFDGVVTQIWTHSGERMDYRGIAKIVDMSRLGVLAEIDEVDLSRVALGSKANIAFGGSTTTYAGTLSRIAPAIKRMQQVEPTASNATESRVVQVEITFDDLSRVPQVVGREVRVTFR